MGKILDILKKLLVFQESNKEEGFILKEYKEGSDEKPKYQTYAQSENRQEEPKKPQNKSKVREPVKLEDKNKTNQQLSIQNNIKQNKVSPILEENLEFLKTKYSIPLSSDVIIRGFDITLGEKNSKAFIIFIDGITDKKVINEYILQPVMHFNSFENVHNNEDIITFLERNIIPQNQLEKSDDYEIILHAINFGSCVLFVDGASQALVLDVKAWEHRNIDKPSVEMNIRGAQEGFGEVLRANTSLIRKNLKNENLVTESIVIGKRSKTPCCIMYIKDLANPNLIEEVRIRLKSINTDYVSDSGIIEQLIEDKTYIPSPQILSTERPDRVGIYLSQGRVAILVDGNPFVLVVPVTFFSLFHSSEDTYTRVPYANLIRFIRALGIVAALLLPGLYVAITNYHHEMIPTDLLLAISAAREKVPFPSVVEIIIMEISFELIREAGIRMPGTIGQTLGIIGALILGQAAVSANIVSPVLIVIVAVTGIGSLATPNYSMSFAFRILRFGYIFLGAIAGLLGIALGLFLHGLMLASTKSFGVPYLAPFAPKTSGAFDDVLNRLPVWMQENRPDYLNPLDIVRQPKISRGWIKKKQKPETGDEKE